MILIMIPYVDVVLIFVGNMFGGETHWLDVSMGNEISHTFYASCFKGSMGDDMATTVDHLLLYEVGHVIFWSTWDMPLMNNWEELFYELPCWKVIHFIWMTPWRWEFLIGNEIPYACHQFYLEEAFEQQEGFHIDLPFSHNESHLVYPPKTNFQIWEEPLEDKKFVEYLKQSWRLLDEKAIRGGGDILQHPCSFLRIRNIWEGDTIMFLN